MINEKIKQILAKNVTDKEKADMLIQLDTENHTKLGLDSTKKERAKIKKYSRKLINEAVKLDAELEYLKTVMDS